MSGPIITHFMVDLCATCKHIIQSVGPDWSHGPRWRHIGEDPGHDAVPASESAKREADRIPVLCQGCNTKLEPGFEIRHGLPMCPACIETHTESWYVGKFYDWPGRRTDRQLLEEIIIRLDGIERAMKGKD